MSNQIFYVNRIGHGSDPITLLNGFGYSGGPTPGANYSVGFTLLNFNTTILAWNLYGNVSGGFVAGAGGPGWATRQQNCKFSVVQSTGEVIMQSELPYTQAGFFLGAAINIGIVLGLNGWSIQWVGGWHGHFEAGWSNTFNESTEISIDLLNIIISIIAYYLQKGNGTATKPAPPTPIYKPYQFYAQSNNAIPDKFNTPLTVTPTVAVRIDFSQYVPFLAALNRTCSSFGGGIQFGPLIGLGFPVNLQVGGIQVNNAVFDIWTGAGSGNYDSYYGREYRATVYRYSGSWPGGTFNNPGAGPFTPYEVGVQYVWSWGIDLTLGVWMSLAICYCFSFSPTFTFNLLSTLGINTNVQSGVSEVLTVAGGINSGYLGEAMRPMEVVFETPEGVTV